MPHIQSTNLKGIYHNVRSWDGFIRILPKEINLALIEYGLEYLDDFNTYAGN